MEKKERVLYLQSNFYLFRIQTVTSITIFAICTVQTVFVFAVITLDV